ncbi:hypothetical protein LSH36_95g01006 [Paralvinella palmiformis]|uniref:PKD domain-containing protein n=1 Tax=Paralvinella palmiformis TaxID=53620 RepID=A0AAD9K1W7_9ANNE|nr:hypothetical protein LSH36_95g01006 [Paralvinella palmiformis]
MTDIGYKTGINYLQSELKAASPNEEFVCSLGVDPTIKIEYKPLVKYREQSGLISKTTMITYKQVIEVKNTHRDTITIQVVDQLPRSTEEKIKRITILFPSVITVYRFPASIFHVIDSREIAVTGLEVSTEYRLPLVIFNLTARSGSSVIIFVDYGDNKTIEEGWISSFLTEYSRIYNYGVSASKYLLACWAFNSLSYVYSDLKICYDVDPLYGDIELINTDLSVSSMISLNPSFTSGQLIELTAEFHDGSNLTKNYASFSDIPNRLNYTYSDVGAFPVNITICTCNDCHRFSFINLVGIPIKGLNLTGNSSIPLGENATFVTKLGNSSQTTCNFTFSGSERNSIQVYKLFTGDGITVQHVFNTTGPHTVSVSCENMFGHAKGDLEIQVIDRAIPDLTIECVDSIEVDANLSINVNVSDGTHLEYKFDFGDGTNPIFISFYDSTSVSRSHVYRDSGHYVITVSARNSLSQQSNTTSVVVQYPFVYKHMSLFVTDDVYNLASRTVGISEDHAGKSKITLHIITPNVPTPTKGYMNITFTNNSEPIHYDIGTYPFTVQSPPYNTTGTYMITAIVYNLVSTISYNITFEVEQYPGDIIFTLPDQPVVFTNPVEFFLINVTGCSHCRISISIDPGDTREFIFWNQLGPHLFNFSGYLYDTPGRHEVQVQVYSNFYNMEKSSVVTILGSLPNMTLTTNSPQIFSSDGALITFRLNIEAQDRISLPCMLLVDFADSSTPLEMERSLIDDITWDYRYYQTSYFRVKINVSTILGYQYYESIINIQIPLSKVSISATLPGQTDERTRYVVATTVQLMAVHNLGTGANYTWIITKAESGTLYHHQVTTDKRILLRMGEYGYYRVEVIANNGLGTTRSGSTHLDIVADGSIAKFEFPPTVVIGQIINFEFDLSLKYNRPPYSFENICIKIRLGNDFFWISCVETFCLDLADEEYTPSRHQVLLKAGSGKYSIRHHFAETGIIPIYAEVIDKDRRFFSRTDGRINVTQYCFPPGVKVKPSSANIYGFRSRVISITTLNFIFNINCVATGFVYAKFAIFRYLNYTERQLGEDITNRISTIQKADGLYIEPRQLNISHYLVQFTLGMGTVENGSLRLATTKQLHLEVLRTDFSVSFRSGKYRQVRSPAVVDLVAGVINPDNPEDVDGFVFTWFCYRYEIESEWAAENVKLPTEAERIEIPLNRSIRDDDLGGCFNTGAGMLIVSNRYQNTLTLNTGLMPTNRSYVIEVIVTKDGRSASTKTRLDVRNIDFLYVNIRKKIIDDIYLLANCTSCSGVDLTIFTWRVRRLEQDDNDEIIFCRSESLPSRTRREADDGMKPATQLRGFVVS